MKEKNKPIKKNMSAVVAQSQLERNELVQENRERFDEKAYEDKKDEREDTKAEKNNSSFWVKNKTHVKNISITFLGRSALIGYSIWITAFAVCVTQDKLFWMLFIPIFLIILDTLYICIVRKGIEFDW